MSGKEMGTITRMKWIAISGSWEKTNKNVESDVRREIRRIIGEGNGIVTGGALGVDYVATDEAIKNNPGLDKLKIFLPVTLVLYAKHYRKRAQEGVITSDQAEMLIAQLKEVQKRNPSAINENKTYTVVNIRTYYERNTAVIKASDELNAFQVNKSGGVQDTIDKAKEEGIPVKLFSYTIE